MLYAFLLNAFLLYAYFYWLHFDTQLLIFFLLQETEECPEEQISFEMVTGYVYTAPADMLDSQVSNDFRIHKKVAENFRKWKNGGKLVKWLSLHSAPCVLTKKSFA